MKKSLLPFLAALLLLASCSKKENAVDQLLNKAEEAVLKGDLQMVDSLYTELEVFEQQGVITDEQYERANEIAIMAWRKEDDMLPTDSIVENLINQMEHACIINDVEAIKNTAAAIDSCGYERLKRSQLERIISILEECPVGDSIFVQEQP